MGAAVGGGDKHAVKSDINMTPLIDIVLVLLIIFMVMTPMMLKELGATMPQEAPKDAPPPAPGDEQFMIDIPIAGPYKLNGKEVSDAQLADELRERLGPKPKAKRMVFFRTDDEAEYGRVVHAMDIARGAGAKVLGVAKPKDPSLETEEEGG